MRHLATGLAGAVIVTAASVPLAAPAHATPPITCTSILGDGIVATVCTYDLEGQVSGHVNLFDAGATVDSLTLYKCNAAETSCTALATTTNWATPTFTAVAGKHYETCASIHVRVTLTTTRYYSGCSPFNVA
ncbi:hypothetical protein [Actinomadura sp. DC4]|uniref:hypothetical protein n=1 Tax=Actinomadura sp. DC4 TaxID=3055069 RepID=UPI0025B24BA6|nr:hypothetical protein [Actinomadura sp. DC4]MDN3353921.1 hypothetical protein [Actinomadura sp. DC4]